MAELSCRACGSTRMIPDAEITDYNQVSSGPLSVSVRVKNPQAASFLGIAGTRDRVSGTLRARVCADCGVAEIYSPEAAQLWAGYSGETSPPAAG